MNASSSPKRVILCADDFAVNASASQGIAELARKGRISATSAMVLSPRWAQDVALLQPVRGRIDVGLHLDWTSEFAVAHGHGLSLGRAMLKAALGGFDRQAARAVIDHQLDLFEAQWQAPPDYVDGHQHVQQFAGIREALVQALQARYGNLSGPRPYLRVSRAPAGSADTKAWVIAAMGAGALKKIANNADFVWARGLLGVYGFTGDEAAYGQSMAKWLAQAWDGSIIMCHPAQAAEAGDEISRARVWEYAYLSHVDFPAALALAGVQLARGQEALAPR